MSLKEGRSLIAYFSHEGYNYVNGRIVNLPIGNTEVAARTIKSIIDADIFRIETVKQYPKDYHETTDVAKKEQKNDERPLLSNHIKDIDSYSNIFIGYPNWWGTMPMAVFTFLEEYDFSGKTIIPFCTHEGSGLGHSESDIKSICPEATVLKGLAIKGSRVNQAEKDISHWLEKVV